MSLNRKRQEILFFVHIPKTGGTSLKAMLHNAKYAATPWYRRLFQESRLAFPEQDRYPSPYYKDAARETSPGNKFWWLGPYFDIDFVRELSPERKRRIRFFVGHMPYCVGELFDCKVKCISFFRDPVARTISHINHARKIQPRLQGKTIEEVYRDPDFFSTAIKDLQTRYFAHQLTESLRMAMAPMELSDEDILRARERIASLDFIGIQEDFDRAAGMLGKALGFSFELEKRRVNSEETEVPDYLMERIAHDNRHDIETYRFAKELYCERGRELPRVAA
jgi:hypothetical protein